MASRFAVCLNLNELFKFGRPSALLCHAASPAEIPAGLRKKKIFRKIRKLSLSFTAVKDNISANFTVLLHFRVFS